MILINLLPHREARRQQRKRSFFMGLAAAAVLGLLAALVWMTVLHQLTERQQQRNDFLRSETAKLEAQIKDIANLRTEIDSLKSRQAAVEDLQLNRNVPVHLLDELVKQTPEGIYLTAIKQTDNEVLLSGLAQTNERVSEYLRNAQANIGWLDRLELVEIKAANAGAPGAVGLRDQRRLFEFSLRMTIRPPGSAEAASAPAGSASAVPRKAV